MKLQHPVTGFVRDVSDERRIQVLRQRGYVEAAADATLGISPGPVQRDPGITPDNDTHDRPVDERPAQSDSKAAWVTYAESRGIDPEGLTKAELIDLVGEE